MTDYREIGSEFWRADCNCIHSVITKTYLSGRTALTAIILDLKREGIQSVCLPSYCCESMIEPFLRQNLKIGFYQVIYEDRMLTFSLQNASGFDAVMLIDYFGFMSEIMTKLICEIQANKQVVLLDQTHSLFSKQYIDSADYRFGSYRKWTGVEAGFAEKRSGEDLFIWPMSEAGERYLRIRRQAREFKTRFVNSGYQDESLRQKQLMYFAQAEEQLEDEYLSDTNEENKKLLAMLDVDSIHEQRNRNAQVIYRNLDGISSCKALFERLPDGIGPLFVPILVHEGKRDALRSYLRDHGVFCPVHWPLSALHEVNKDGRIIYLCEMSLVCDQRYDETDMTHMMEIIKIWKNM
ncbi:hypothetical protein [Hungatella hathewayi]